mmetsp:Transcript_153789/g.493134  ORF Transcript_153789/g.493134 Transcript_153789/m.493134 type:complete len:109 (-) Transcript_153789:501-827(-)
MVRTLLSLGSTHNEANGELDCAQGKSEFSRVSIWRFLMLQNKILSCPPLVVKFCVLFHVAKDASTVICGPWFILASFDPECLTDCSQNSIFSLMLFTTTTIRPVTGSF